MGRMAGSPPPGAVKVRRGPLRVSFHAAGETARVHLAVPKSVGTAVVRNRVRRRVRETLREFAREEPLAGGEYQLGVSSSLERLSAAELRTMMGELLKGLQRR